MKHKIIVVALFAFACHAGEQSAVRARYLMLTSQVSVAAPVVSVDFIRGPIQQFGKYGQVAQWWQLEARAKPEQDAPPLFVLRALTSADPLARGAAPQFYRYILRIPDLNETLEYKDSHSGNALLPPWKDFEKWFVPHATEATRRQSDMPESCELLGHILTLTHVNPNEPWQPWTDAKLLELDREMLVGTGRNFKDKEGHRLPQTPKRQNYTYIPFVEDDYRVMFEAGMNIFTVSPEQEQFVRAQPVFYWRGAEGKPPLRYPADLYRSNYVGPVMFMDEPAILMVGDKNVNGALRHFSEAAALIEKRTRTSYLEEGYGAFTLEHALHKQGANFGDMRLMQWDLPSWETFYDTTFYQMKGGGNGLVHEGRYNLPAFDKAIAKASGAERAHTAHELLQYYFAFLRGGTRPFNKFWGTAIYGQCDPTIATEAVTTAYDMGARYIWFWTSDHDHHLPWNEQLALARAVKAHAQAHPRPSIYTSPRKLDTAIVIPNGYFLSLENLWWVRAMDKERQNETGQRYTRLLQRALKAVHECFDRHETFDITVDDGRPIEGYGRLVHINDEP